ncbi:TPA: helix-turn-helix domain-containing protein, partial [Candidatus Bathyarchaeota archaeon]|nr:helix-turn-helix domain-containing protein [Candidatus Bathyarchaeota archaeon]
MPHLFLLGITEVSGGENVLPSLKEIERRRKSLGLSQKKLARLVGVSQSFIAKIESGKISPSYEKTKKIFDVLDSLEMKKEMKVEEIMHKEVV